jgi:hypothetical protein
VSDLPYQFFSREDVDGGRLQTVLLYLLKQTSLGVVINVYADDETVAIGDGTVGIPITALLNGYNLTDAIATIHTPGSANTTDIQIRRARAGTSVDMLSTKITIAYADYYAKDGVINTINDDVATGDMLYVDVDAIATDVAGLSVGLTFKEV